MLSERLLPIFFASKHERALEHSGRLLEFLVKEASFAREIQLCRLYLDAILLVARPLSVALTCHLAILLPLVIDMLDNEHLRSDDKVVELVKLILDTCWPRLHVHSTLLLIIHKKLSSASWDGSDLIERIKPFCL